MFNTKPFLIIIPSLIGKVDPFLLKYATDWLDEIAIFETVTQEFTNNKSTSCAGVLVVLSIVIVCENTLELNANNKK